MLIRAAIPEDAEAIVKILNPIIEAGIYTVIDGPLTVAQERGYIQNFPWRGVFHVAVSPDNRILGFQSLEPIAVFQAFSHIASMGTFIDLSQRRRGIGAALSEKTFASARQMGFQKIFTYVRSDNAPSLRFHLKLGFQIVGTARRHARIADAYIDETVIELFL